MDKRWSSTTLVNKVWRNSRFVVAYEHKSNDGIIGRFGGGWNWKLGFQCSTGCIMIFLLVSSLRIEWYRGDSE